MIAPLNPNGIPTAQNSDSNSNSNIDEEYEQRKRIWEVIKVLCKDPIAEISRNANKVKSYMTSDKVKSSRSRALSDPEKHAKLIKDKTTQLKNNQNNNNEIIHRSSSDNYNANNKLKKPTHNKPNTIFTALSGGIGSNQKKNIEKLHHNNIIQMYTQILVY